MLKEFKEFAMKGNVIDMAVASLSGSLRHHRELTGSRCDYATIGLLLGNVDFANLFAVLKEGKVAGLMPRWRRKISGAVTINFGVFINTIISFILIALLYFFLCELLIE